MTKGIDVHISHHHHNEIALEVYRQLYGSDLTFVNKNYATAVLEAKNYAKKLVIHKICYFRTKVRKWFEMGSNQ